MLGSVLNFSFSELLLVGLIFFLVMASPKVGRVGEILFARPAPRKSGGRRSPPSGPGQDER
jgi:hypothetical protein